MIELASLLVLGFLAQWLAWRIRVPAILPLILIGLAVGPISTNFTANGEKLIDGDDIFQGDLLFDVVSISVGLILFEGGLTLRLNEVKNLVRTVRNLIIVGTLVTLFGGAAAVHFIFDMSPRFAFIFSALIIVTGPTVIGPILRNVRPNFNISTILKWEGILIDPVGALIAILIYEFVISGQENKHFTVFALQGFLQTVVSGLVIGTVFAFLLRELLTKNWVPKYLRNVVVLAMVILCFALSDLAHAESGLLAVTVLGMILANLRIQNLKEILSFKEDVVLILISFLFVMLSSRMKWEEIKLLFDWRSAMLFAIVIFILRPLAVFVSAIGSGLNLREKLFISWISPRGIVAAGVASLFSVRLQALLKESGSFSELFQVQLLLPLTFMIIVGTVVLQGLTAKPMARLLGVEKSEPNGVLFFGAGEPARFIAKYLLGLNIPVLMADTSQSNIREAEAQGLPVFQGSLVNDEVFEDVDLSQYGQLFAMTSNTEINTMCCKVMMDEFGENKVYRLASSRELDNKETPKHLLFKGAADYVNFTQLIRKQSSILNYEITSNSELQEFIDDLADKIVPLFLLIDGNKIEPVTHYPNTLGQQNQLFYIVKN